MKNTVNRKCRIMLLIIIAVLIVSGCGSNSKEAVYPQETYAATAYGYDIAYTAEEAMVEGAGIAYKSSSAESLSDTGNTAELNLDSLSQDRKLIRNINVCLETEKYDTVNENIKKKVKEFGGYIENYSEYRGSYNYNSNRSSDITARIPANKVDSFLNESFQDAFMTSMSENTQDVTLQYTDLETRLASYITERDRLLELMEKAEDVDSIIAIEERLTEVRYQIESIESSLRSYDNKVDYSTVWISLQEVKKVEASQEATFLERIKTGFVKNTAELAESLENFAVWFITNILSILLAIGIIALIIVIVRKIAKKNSDRKEKDKEKLNNTKNKENIENPKNTENTENTVHKEGTEN